MKVVLDTNIIVADFWMRSPSFEILFDLYREDKIELYIPKIVADEVVNKYQERLNEIYNNYQKVANSFTRLTRKTNQPPINKQILEESLSDYTSNLKSKIEKHNIQILPYPKTSHERLAKRAMKKKKPFDPHQNGYRDSLIWETIKDLMTGMDFQVASPELIFITSNWTDFTTKDFNLHEDLISDLDNEAIYPDSIRVFKDLIGFNEELGKLFYEQESSVRDNINNGFLYDFNLKKTVTPFLWQTFVNTSINSYMSYAESDSQECTIECFEEDYEPNVNAVRKMNSNDYIVDFSFELSAGVHFFIDRGDAFSLPDDTDITILDGKWNRHVMLASRPQTLQMEMTAIISSDLIVTSCEISDVQFKKDS